MDTGRPCAASEFSKCASVHAAGAGTPCRQPLREPNLYMATDLAAMQRALAGLSDAELHALIEASNKAPHIAYGLLVWIEGAYDWELNRRAGHDYELLPAEAAIDPSEDTNSIRPHTP